MTSPYGPQRRTDEAADGANSTYETTPSAERPKDDPSTATESGDRKVKG